MVHRHDRLRDWLAKWIADMLGSPTNTEQLVPKWARMKPDGSVEEARLDIVFYDKGWQKDVR